jgi:hypothetical protein
MEMDFCLLSRALEERTLMLADKFETSAVKAAPIDLSLSIDI